MMKSFEGVLIRRADVASEVQMDCRQSAEVRKDAQLAREVEFALPRELDQAEGVRLGREFVKAEFVDKGMIADLNVHWDIGADGLTKPHAHVMLTTRSVDRDGFGPKIRDWNATALLERWRERWASKSTCGSPNSISMRASSRPVAWSTPPREAEYRSRPLAGVG